MELITENYKSEIIYRLKRGQSELEIKQALPMSKWRFFDEAAKEFIDTEFTLENNIKAVRKGLYKDLDEMNELIIQNYKKIEELEIDLACLKSEKRKLEKRERALQDIKNTLTLPTI